MNTNWTRVMLTICLENRYGLLNKWRTLLDPFIIQYSVNDSFSKLRILLILYREEYIWILAVLAPVASR